MTENGPARPTPVSVIPTPPVYSGSLRDLPPAYTEVYEAMPDDLDATGNGSAHYENENAASDGLNGDVTNSAPLSGQAQLSDVRLAAMPIGEPPPTYTAEPETSNNSAANDVRHRDEGESPTDNDQ